MTVPENVVFMKSGFFIRESLEKILTRKMSEFLSCGYFLWGYSGTICHPFTQVQPFAEQVVSRGKHIYWVTSYTSSPFKKPERPTQEYSPNGKDWYPLPDDINVYSSTHALCCGEPQICTMELDISEFSVAIGGKKGTPLTQYIRHHVDKACASRDNAPSVPPPQQRIERIFLKAELLPPYAVQLRY